MAQTKWRLHSKNESAIAFILHILLVTSLVYRIIIKKTMGKSNEFPEPKSLKQSIKHNEKLNPAKLKEI